MKRLAIALACALPLATQAVEFNQVQADRSAINFTYTQMGVAVDGKFKRFSSQFSFDPSTPTPAKAPCYGELASGDNGAPENDHASA